jgi:hypothetical protein
MWYCAMAGERKGANAPMTKIAAKLLILSFASAISLFVQRPVGGHALIRGHFFPLPIMQANSEDPMNQTQVSDTTAYREVTPSSRRFDRPSKS